MNIFQCLIKPLRSKSTEEPNRFLVSENINTNEETNTNETIKTKGQSFFEVDLSSDIITPLDPENQNSKDKRKQHLSDIVSDSCCRKNPEEYERKNPVSERKNPVSERKNPESERKNPESERKNRNVNISAKFFFENSSNPISAKKNPDSFGVIEQFIDLVIRKLQYKMNSEIPMLREKLNKVEIELENAIRPIDKKYLNLQVGEINQQITKLTNIVESFKKASKDKLDTLRILFLSREELLTRIQKSEGSMKDNPDMALLKTLNEKIQDVYFEVLNIIELFLPNEIIYEKDEEYQKKKCLNCKSVNFIIQSGIIYCSNCYFEISPEISLYSINRNNVYNTYAYEERENFKKAMIRFQGKQKVKFPKDFFEKLDEYFVSYGFPKGEEVRQKKMRPDKELLLKALSEKKFNKYYEDINLICNIYWGFELPDISHIENKLLEDYEKFNEAYKRLKKERKSSLNIQFLLYKLLKRNGFPCTKSDFKLMKTADILEYHERIYQEVCKELGW
jgi:hypothetical protein